MRTFIFLFCTTLFAIGPYDVVSQNSKIKIEKDKTLKVDEVFDLIMDQTNYKFFYEEGIFKEFPKVHVKKGTIRTNKLLSLSLSKGNLDITVTDNNAIVIKDAKTQTTQSNFQELEVSGTITDANGQPLPGANIVVKGTTNGTQTDFDGKYTIKINNKNAILIITYIGFKTTEIAVNNNSNPLNITLEEDAASLDEIVVVGYGTQRKETITGSISTVKSEELTQTPATNTTALLSGRLPGIVVSQNNGQPGGDQANVSIRGFVNALVIVDGVPRDYQQLDPNEIESISILKDASAAVYGARAGNGVILVTTKRGKTGAPKINYSGSYTLQQPTFLPKVANAANYAKYQQQAELLEGVAVADLTFSDDDISKYAAGTEEGYRGTDWQDVVLKDWAAMQQHNFNVQGGSENVKYFTSIGQLTQNSLLESGDGEFKRYNIGATVDIKINDKLNVGVNLKYREEKNETPSGRDGDDNDGYFRIFDHVNSMDPTVEQNPDGFLTAAHPLETNAVAYSTQAITGINNTQRKQMDAILSFDYKLPFIDGLSAFGTLAHQTVNSLNRLTRTPFTTYDYDYATGVSSPRFTTSDDYVRSTTNDNKQTTTQIGFNYKNQFNDNKLEAKVILENRYIDRYFFSSQVTQLLSSDTPFLFGAVGTQTTTDLLLNNSGNPIPLQEGRQGIIGRVNYSYKDKYLLEALFRADANIQFPEATRWGYFPGFSLGWVVSKENFLQDSETIDFLKFRTSFASLGFDGTSSFDYLSGYGLQNGRANTYAYGNTSIPSTLQTIGLANTSITWETMETYNFGVDATLWNSLLGIELDMFYRRRSGILRNRIEQFPDTFGADLPQENAGIRSNRGFELVLNHRNQIGELKLDVSANVTWTREKIIDNVEREFDLTDPDDARLNQTNGQWANRRFGYRTDGFYDSQDEIDNDGITYDPDIGEPTLGDVKYIDRNEDGTIDYRDQELIGRNETPELFFGLNVNANYKGFDFGMLWQGAGNFDVMMRGSELAANTSIGQMPLQYQADYAWNANNTAAAKLPAPTTSGLNNHNDQPLDIYQKDGTYLRLKSVTLGYSIPKTILEKVNIKNARVYISGYNLLTIQNTGIFDIDPELRGNGVTAYPLQRNISVGVNIGL
ncbi:TonB-dependent receptor [Postechiella marina]|uniref:TonB-dependent receptor n=1 Tax=Postechiella marina TaxID=943941 RepID=A0ABP8C4Y8_9FLAO